MKEERTRRLAAIMFTDIVGYTALMQQDEKMAAKIRAHHREVFDQQHESHHGEILQYYGDGTLSIFQSVIEAVECAIAIQRLLQKEDPVPLRIGIHMGDIVLDGTEVYGDGVNVASRIESMGVAGAILLSKSIHDELKNHQHINTLSLGQFSLKNIEHPTEVFAVTNDEIKIPHRAELKGKQTGESKSIAVLPFVNMSSSEDNEYFSDGMTEEIINALAKIKHLKVTSRTSSFFFKNKDIPLSQIGQELNVSTILEGSVRLSGDNMRITAQLINVADDFHFWSETFDRSMENIFAVQDEISLLIADKLREHIGHFNLGDQLVDAPEVAVEIYKKYLKGRYHLLKLNLSDVEKGISILKDVIEQDPVFPLAYLGVNYGYIFLGAIGMMPTDEAFTTGKYYLDKAIELDENLPECQYGLAGISYWQKWDLEATFQHLNKALELRPAYADAYQTMAPILATAGKMEAALRYIDKALQLDPFSATNYYLKGLIFYFQENFEKAISCFEKSIGLDPKFILSKLIWSTSLLLMGREKESLAIYQTFPSDKLGVLSKLGGTTFVYAFLGDRAKAETGIAQLEEALQSDSMGWALHFLILCQTVLGRHDHAFSLMEQGITQKLPMMLTLVSEPILKPLHSSPRFHELMQQVLGKKYYTGSPKSKDQPSSLNKDNYSKLLREETSLKKKPLLDTATRQAFAQKLLIAIEGKAPYLQSNLSLKKLADLVDILPNQLSWLLNNHFAKSYNEFINHYRVEAFKRLAKDPKNAHFTLMGLAFESGFNSKTVFNTYFKKETGVTPTAWIKSEAKE